MKEKREKENLKEIGESKERKVDIPNRRRASGRKGDSKIEKMKRGGGGGGGGGK